MKNKLYIFFILLAFLWPGISLCAQQKAKPRSGEGVTAFLLRHDRSPQKYYNDFIRLNKKKLGKNNALQLGIAYIIPPLKPSDISGSSSDKSFPKKGSVVRQPLFGKKKEEVKVISNHFSGACFYIVSGHGGPDPGAIGKARGHELHEDEYAYDIALRLAYELIRKGAKVHIIIQDAKDGIRDGAYLSNSKRETCMGDPIPLNQVQRLQQRCDKINILYKNDRNIHKYCRAIFLHIDSRSKGKRMDVFFYHSGLTASSHQLANNMKRTFQEKYDKHQPNRGFSGTVSTRNLYVLSHSVPSAVFVELGNIQNEFDQRRLVISSNRQALAKWLAEGFLRDYKASF